MKRDAKPKSIAAVMLVLSVLAAVGCRRIEESVPRRSVPEQVPEAYQATYHEVDGEFSRLLPLVRLPGGHSESRTAFGVELLPADSSRGEALLGEGVLGACQSSLDRLTALGVQCVSLHLDYLLLTRDYPRCASYRDFYRQLAEEIRRRGLRIVAEMGAGSPGPEPGRMGAGLRGLTRERFTAGLKETAEAILADIRPDFLTVLSEPDTQTRNTGLSFSPAEFAAAVKQVVGDLNHPGVRLGAGAGSWSALAYFRELSAIPELDYIELHIGPIQFGFAAERPQKAAETARARGKAIAIGEAWLYKVSTRELSRISPGQAFSRDVFSFWQPLDRRFIELVVQLAHQINAEFCSFYGMNALFGYLEFTQENGRLAPAELARLGEQAAAQDILRGRLSATGETLQDMIRR